MTTQVSERISACQTCRARQRNRCRLANQIVTVLARMPGAECPIGRWPNTANKNHQRSKAKAVPRPKASPPLMYPKAESREIKRLAAVTCHYNPCGYKLLEDNYHRFTRALPSDLELWTVELAYDDAPFRLPDGPRMLRVRGDSRHVLWQKEWLLNLAIDALPSDVNAAAWIDADLIWLNRDWVEEARRLLERYNAVQLFEHVIDSDREGRLSQKSPSHVYARMHGLGYGRPGGAWAARREAIAGGLYDRHAIGGGNSAMLCAWEGRKALFRKAVHVLLEDSLDRNLSLVEKPTRSSESSQYRITSRGEAIIDTGTEIATIRPLLNLVQTLGECWKSHLIRHDDFEKRVFPTELFLIAVLAQREICRVFLHRMPEISVSPHVSLDNDVTIEHRREVFSAFEEEVEKLAVTGAKSLALSLRELLESWIQERDDLGLSEKYEHGKVDSILRAFTAMSLWIRGEPFTQVKAQIERSSIDQRRFHAFWSSPGIVGAQKRV